MIPKSTLVNIDIFGYPDREFSKVIDALRQHLSPLEQEGIKRITTALRDYAFGDIKKIETGDNVLATFILCSCFIEQMATYRYGTDNVGSSSFKDFVREYLKDYDPTKLRVDLRNKLVHNYSLGEYYALTMRSASAHLQKDLKGSVIINLENFIRDLENALKTLLTQLITDHEIRRLALKILSKNHIVGMSNIDLVTAEVNSGPFSNSSENGEDS